MQDCTSLRFHPRRFYRADRGDTPGTRDAWPTLIAAATDLSGTLTGLHRTWLDLHGGDKASVVTPQRAMGELLGHDVRFGQADDVLAAGEGIETMPSLRQVMPTLPTVAALSAAHLAALVLPPTLGRLYIAGEADAAGRHGAHRLAIRAAARGIGPRPLTTPLADLNAHLMEHGADDLRSLMRIQLVAENVRRFVVTETAGRRTCAA